MKDFFFTELQEHRCLLHKNFLFGLVTEFLAFVLFVSGWKSAHQTFLVSHILWMCLVQRLAIIEFQLLLFLHLFTFCDLLYLITLSGGCFPLHHIDVVRLATSETIASFSSQFDSLNLAYLLQVHAWREDNKTLFRRLSWQEKCNLSFCLRVNSILIRAAVAVNFSIFFLLFVLKF